MELDRLKEVGEEALIALQQWDAFVEPSRPKRPRGSVVSSGVAVHSNEAAGVLFVDNLSST